MKYNFCSIIAIILIKKNLSSFMLKDSNSFANRLLTTSRNSMNKNFTNLTNPTNLTNLANLTNLTNPTNLTNLANLTNLTNLTNRTNLSNLTNITNITNNTNSINFRKKLYQTKFYKTYDNWYIIKIDFNLKI